MRIGIITLHCSYNFGSSLQAFALQTAIERLGHEAKIIDYRSEDFDQYKLICYKHPRQALRVLRNFGAYWRRRRSFEAFIHQSLRLTPRRFNYKDLTALDQLQTEFDCFVCGSDQIWNLDLTRGADGAFFLTFAGHKRRVAYAPSLTHTSFKDKYFDRQEIAGFLNNFDYLSVRERETLPIFQSLTDKEIQVVVDPTLLLDSKDYEKLIEPRQESGYIFVYNLRECPELVESADEIARSQNKQILYVANKDLPLGNSKNLFGIGPSEFVSLMKGADAVLTNSFHGTVFSLLFHRPFRTYATDNSASRIHDLLSKLGLLHHMTTGVMTEPIPPVAWNEVDRGIEGLREDSLNYLREALA
jgi:hypothetical protein